MTVKSQLDAKVYLALNSTLQAMVGAYDIVEPDETYPTDAGRAFIVVQDVRFEPTSPFVGSDTQNENRGILSLSVMVPLSWSHAQALGIAGDIRATFPKGSRHTWDDVLVSILETPTYEGTSRRDMGFRRLDVQVRWRCAG